MRILNYGNREICFVLHWHQIFTTDISRKHNLSVSLGKTFLLLYHSSAQSLIINFKSISMLNLLLQLLLNHYFTQSSILLGVKNTTVVLHFYNKVEVSQLSLRVTLIERVFVNAAPCAYFYSCCQYSRLN